MNVHASQEMICYGLPASVLVVNSKILIALIVLNTFISITATIGNLLVLATVWQGPNLRSPSNTMLFGLALSGLCVGLVSEPLYVGCQAVVFKNLGKITSCTLLNTRTLITPFFNSSHPVKFTAMSVDRNLAIYLHLRYEQVVTEMRARKVILCLLFMSIVPLVMMIFDATTSVLLIILTVAVCLVIISFPWIKIYQVIGLQQAQIQDQMAVATQSFNMARFRNSAINTLLVLIIVLACLCWTCISATRRCILSCTFQEFEQSYLLYT